ncbi:MAG: hypothetical protein ACJAZF_005059 [Granulosicoccus sp.]
MSVPRRDLFWKLECLVGISISLISCSSDGGNNSSDTNANPTVGGSETTSIISVAEFSDEFISNSLSNWTLRHPSEGEAAQHTVLDMNQINVGTLTIQPTITSGWFAGGKAPLIYKRVTGNVSVDTFVNTRSAANPALPPGSDYNSAGLMVRTTGTSGENYGLINIGRQTAAIENSLGTETQNMTNSSSVLDLQSGCNNGRLTLCRIGADFIAYRQLDNETQWTKIRTVVRSEISETAQVGMIVNGYSGPDIMHRLTTYV